MKELIIIRHARSEYNVQETKELNSPLTKFGVKQAKNLGKFFLKNDIWKSDDSKYDLNYFKWNVYTSPFLRCLQTTKELITPLWEKHTNDKGGVHYRLMPISSPLIGEYLEIEDDEVREVLVKTKFEFTPNICWDLSGETFKSQTNKDFFNRVCEFYEEHCKENTIVVTHGMVALTLAKIATENINHVPMWDYSINNASITWIQNGRIKWYGRCLHNEPGLKY